MTERTGLGVSVCRRCLSVTLGTYLDACPECGESRSNVFVTDPAAVRDLLAVLGVRDGSEVDL